MLISFQAIDGPAAMTGFGAQGRPATSRRLKGWFHQDWTFTEADMNGVVWSRPARQKPPQ